MCLNKQAMVGAYTLLLRVIPGYHPQRYLKMVLARTYIFDDACKYLLKCCSEYVPVNAP